MILRAGLAIEIARLRVEVRRQLSEVEQSRTRIVTATYEERRRLERDLHDGAQQRLVSLGLDLRHVQHELGEATGGDAKATLDPVVAGLAEAIEELRELARGVRPAALDDGLAAALAELAARAPISTEVEATAERFDHEIEAAAYFVASEALDQRRQARGQLARSCCARAATTKPRAVGLDDGRGGAAARVGLGPDRPRPTESPPSAVASTCAARARDGAGGGVPVRVVIAEDQALLREGLARLFADANHEVVATVGDADRLRAAVSEHDPDLAVVDVRMPPASPTRASALRIGSVTPIPTSASSSSPSTSSPPAPWNRSPRAVRLPAQGPGPRGQRVHGRGRARGARWLSTRSSRSWRP